MNFYYEHPEGTMAALQMDGCADGYSRTHNLMAQMQAANQSAACMDLNPFSNAACMGSLAQLQNACVPSDYWIIRDSEKFNVPKIWEDLT